MCLEFQAITRHESTLNTACLIFGEFYPRAKLSATYEIAEGILQTSENVQNAFRLQLIFYFRYSEATMLVTGKRFPCHWVFVRASIIFLDFPHKGSCGAMVFRWCHSQQTVRYFERPGLYLMSVYICCSQNVFMQKENEAGSVKLLANSLVSSWNAVDKTHGI